MAKELTIIENELSQKVIQLFQKKTPKNCIKHRPGAGGMSFPYVEVGYIVNELNNAFGLFWEWKIIDKQVGKKQIWVQGELTVKDPVTNFSITKTQFGGADIKYSKATGEPIDIANDLKAASSDALKKTASLFGIASDIFYKEVDQYESLPSSIPTPTNEEQEAKDHLRLMKKMFALASEKGYTEKDIDTVISKKYKLESKKDLSNEQLEEVIAKLENALVKESKPTKVSEVIEGKDVEEIVEEAEEIFDTESEETEEAKSEYVPLCVYSGCTKGENGTRAIRPEGETLFCSDECRKAYEGTSL